MARALASLAQALKVAAIIPVINEAERLRACIEAIREQVDLVVVADGGSDDASVDLAESLGAKVVRSPKGRAVQMNAGADCCKDAHLMIFVHADVVLAHGSREAIEASLVTGARWGRFDVRLDSNRWALRMVSTLMNWRSRITGIATGDQAIFITREAWLRCGGWPEVALMEDVELSSQLLRVGWRPACLRQAVTVSARKWERDGIWRTIMLMWLIRALHAMGVSTDTLLRLYTRNR